jgi:hypothetical protein
MTRESPTGRRPSEPNMQPLRPRLTPEQQAMVDNIRSAIERQRER